jgi:DNA-binding MarR family transcriptional regulator
MTPKPRLILLLNTAQRRLQQWLTVEQARHVNPGAGAPTVAQGGVLFVLASADGVTMGELGQALDLVPSATSGLVQRMETLGWVKRCPCPRDGRTQRVWLQPAGRHQLPAMREALTQVNERLCAGFTDAELNTVARWLTHVQALGESSTPSTHKP